MNTYAAVRVRHPAASRRHPTVLRDVVRSFMLATERTYTAVMNRLHKVLAWTGGLIALLFVLVAIEASGGHDGYLCEWGYDADGDRMGDSSCG